MPNGNLRRFTARRCTMPASVGTASHLLIVAQPVAVDCARVANIGTDATGVNMPSRATDHEVGTGSANLTAIEKKADMFSLRVRSAQRYAMRHGFQAHAMAGLAFV